MRAAAVMSARAWRRNCFVFATAIWAASFHGCLGTSKSSGDTGSGNLEPSYFALAGEHAIFDATRLVLHGHATELRLAPQPPPTGGKKDNSASREQLLKRWDHNGHPPPSHSRVHAPLLQLPLPAVSKMELVRRLAAKGLSTAGKSVELRRRLLLEGLSDEEIKLQCHLLGVPIAATMLETRMDVARELALA